MFADATDGAGGASDAPASDAGADGAVDAAEDLETDDAVTTDARPDAPAPGDVARGDAVDGDTPDAGGQDVDAGGTNVHPNPGFERGTSWRRTPATATAFAWSRTGDPIHESDATFAAHEGRAALKLWGAYDGTYPNTQLHAQEFDGAVAGDTVTVRGHLFTHEDDALARGNAAAVVAIALDEGGTELGVAEAPIDPATPGVWQERTATLLVPAGTAVVRAGVRFTQPAAETSGSVYADGFATTSTGTLVARETRELVWSDEFDGVNEDGTGLDRSRWFAQVWPAYHVNNELQTYLNRSENIIVEDGLLTLRAIRGDVSGAEYSSGRIETDGLAAWRYGRFEARLQVPDTRGTWPAFWMLPQDWAYGGWPDSGEIDIMEYVGCDPELVHATVHTGAYNHTRGTQRGDSMTLPTAPDAFHTYAVDWTPDRLVFTVDGAEVHRFDNDGAGDSATWPFDRRFYLILNLAVGGDWGGYCGVDAGGWPQDLRVDWVRVYQTSAEAAQTP